METVLVGLGFEIGRLFTAFLIARQLTCRTQVRLDSRNKGLGVG